MGVDGDTTSTTSNSSLSKHEQQDEDVKSDSTIRQSDRTEQEVSYSQATPSNSPQTTPQGSHEVHEERPPLPPRPNIIREEANGQSPTSKTAITALRPRLQATPTTALSRTDIHTQSYQDGHRETFAEIAQTSSPGRSPRPQGSTRRFKGLSTSEAGDAASVRSYAPTLETGGDAESLLGDVLGSAQEDPAWKLFSGHGGDADIDEVPYHDEDEETADFYREFDEIPAVTNDGEQEEVLLARWKSKRKHFLILSSAGKPIYSRHGDDNLISSTMGTIQTIISFYEDAKDQLKSFTAGRTKFVIMSQGPLYLVAISKLGESDTQLRVQLDALYMQILSTLTLPTLTTLFSNRPSTDLRRPLKGTDVLLSALADTFTRGSPPALLSALECLKMKKSHRKVIDDILLRTRSTDLLYGLIVAGGRLVSVIRPRKHSLHAGDLQLIFNMLFEADGIKAGGGENWIPLCLPGFNRNGYLYMYVSFLPVSESDDEDGGSHARGTNETDRHDEIAILLISANRESFDELRSSRDSIVAELDKTNSMTQIKSAVRAGRPTATDIVPGTVLHHFIYKSKANVQFVMPSYEPHYTTLLARRRLLSLYHRLHASVHAKNAHLKVHHCISRDSVSLAWVTPLFELYCVAGPRASRNALAQSANKVVQWARREEERVFIIGGGVF